MHRQSQKDDVAGDVLTRSCLSPQSTNVLALLRNPVVLVMLGGVGLMWLLTKCVDFDELKVCHAVWA